MPVLRPTHSPQVWIVLLLSSRPAVVFTGNRQQCQRFCSRLGIVPG